MKYTGVPRRDWRERPSHVSRSRLLAAHRLLGELATAARRYPDAAAHLDEALPGRRLRRPHERALTLLAYANCAWR